MYQNIPDIMINLFLCMIDMALIMEIRMRIYGNNEKGRRIRSGLAIGIVLLLGGGPFCYETGLFIYPVSLIMLHMALWPILFLCLKLCNDIPYDLPLSLWGIFLIIPFSTMISSVALIYLLSENILERPSSDIVHLIVEITFLFMNIILLEFLRRFSIYLKELQKKELLEQQIRYQKEYYRNLLMAYDTVKKVRHDMKNHLQTISLLYNNRKMSELQEYLFTTSEVLRETEQIIFTGNTTLDAILNIKFNEISEKGIRYTTDFSIPQNLQIPYSDIVTIFGNLLDNAIIACSKVKMQAVLLLRISYRENTLLIMLSNTCSEKVPQPYGIGMKNIDSVVKKYSGTMQTKVENGNYITNIILYNI